MWQVGPFGSTFNKMVSISQSTQVALPSVQRKGDAALAVDVIHQQQLVELAFDDTGDLQIVGDAVYVE